MIRRLFVDHPASVGEGYFEHMASALSFSLAMAVGAAVCLVHAVAPGLFAGTGSRIVSDLHGRMVTHRIRNQAPAD
jgi:hypothetical protein